jgi:hypothetical protein
VQAMQYAQLAAGSALISGPKNVEMVIAYIVLRFVASKLSLCVYGIS